MGYPKNVDKHRSDKYLAVWSALDNLVEAWEALEGGTNHSTRTVERWLAEHMSPAINNAREVLGRKPPRK